MGITLLFLFQLWTQPSTRIMGFGNNFADFVPDYINDFIQNPAYLKIMNEYAEYNFPQVYSSIRSFNSTTSTEIMSDKEFYDNDELMSIGFLYPKLGLAGRYGIWQRRTGIGYGSDGFLRLFGQAGLSGALNILKWINIGGEYNCSWNNRPDSLILITYDSLGGYYAHISELIWSNEIGIGILLHKNPLEFSASGKINYENENFTSDIPFYFERGPEGLLTAFETNYYDLKFNTRLRYNPNNFTHTINFNCFRKQIARDGVNHSMDYYLTAFRPGIGTVYYPKKNFLTIASVSYEIDNIDYVVYPGTTTTDQNVIGLIGFEAQLSRILNFRFGNTLSYNSHYGIKQTKNDICFGVDIMPYEKMIFNIATSNPLDYKYYFFGINFIF